MRTSMFRRFALAAVVPAVLFALAVTATPAQAAPNETRAAGLVPFQTLQADILRWTNHQRARHGCAPVRSDNRLIRAARDHSAWMARTGRTSHTGSGGSSFATRVLRAGYPSPLSENIAWGYRSSSEVINAWMRSPRHRTNILNCRAKAVGIGAVYSSNGTPYYTQDFGTR